MNKMLFNLISKHQPAGDQPKAIRQLVNGLQSGSRKQTLLGVTGSGKTFTMANVITRGSQPALILAHNKTLAAQLAQEFQTLFPENAVHYFVSYYDFYQPEAYIAATDTYIEKDAQVNQEIDRLRHASTQSLLSRRDVIIVASVSAIYGLGSPQEYLKSNLLLSVGDQLSKRDFLLKLVRLHYERTNADIRPGKFRALGNNIDISPPSEKSLFRLVLLNNKIEKIVEIDPVSSRIIRDHEQVLFFPAKHFLTDVEQKERALGAIEQELTERVKFFEEQGKILEADRIGRKTRYDLALIREVGYCNGIENYSRHLSGKVEGEAPDTLLSYFPHHADGSPDFLTIIDESHVTVPQIRGMYAGDASRKQNLVNFGFRLPSARDNRPLRYDEFEERTGQVIYTSATPGEYERSESDQIVEQIIRPTGLVDPMIEIRPVSQSGS